MAEHIIEIKDFMFNSSSGKPVVVEVVGAEILQTSLAVFAVSFLR
jgi:hypothetical protein